MRFKKSQLSSSSVGLFFYSNRDCDPENRDHG